MKLDLMVIVFCFSFNPFIRKKALTNLSSETGYSLIQCSTTLGNILYLIHISKNIRFKEIKINNSKYAILSSTLTILSSYKMNQLLKINNISNLNSKIQILTILMSYLIDFQNISKLNKSQILGLGFMLTGIILTKTNS